MENSVNQLINNFEARLKSDTSLYVDAALKDLFASLKPLDEKMQKEYGIRIANIVYKYALNAYNSFNKYELVSLLSYSRLVYFEYSDVEEIALKFLDITKGYLEMKMQMRECDNLEIYQVDIEDVMEHLPITPSIGLECMLCYANLQALWSLASQDMFTAQPLSFVEKNVDNMELISSKHPNDEDINLVYCRSLAATTSELYNDPNRELYRKFFSLLKNLAQTRTLDVPREISVFLRQA